MTELISVIVPVYKVEDYLERCIESILKQTYPYFELILIDDGSLDDCGEICDIYAQKDNRIKVIHQTNQGVSAARNAGIDWAFDHSKSQWITFIDSDDWIHPQYLEVLYKAVVDTNLKVAVCDHVKTGNDKYIFDNLTDCTLIITPEELLRKRRFVLTTSWGKIYSKSVLEKIRFPVGKIREDEFVTWKILFDLNEIAFVKDSLYVYFQRDDSIMHSKWNIQHLYAKEAFEEQLLYFKEKEYNKALEHTIVTYVFFLAQCIENINRYYPKCRTKDIKIRILELYKGNRKLFSRSIREKAYIYAMSLPFNANIVPWIFKKMKYLKEIYSRNGIRGIFKHLSQRIKREL